MGKWVVRELSLGDPKVKAWVLITLVWVELLIFRFDILLSPTTTDTPSSTVHTGIIGAYSCNHTIGLEWVATNIHTTRVGFAVFSIGTALTETKTVLSKFFWCSNFVTCRTCSIRSKFFWCSNFVTCSLNKFRVFISTI